VSLVGRGMQASGCGSKASGQSPVAITAIVAVLGLGTVAMLAFGVLVSTRFRLDPRTHAVLMAEIEHFRGDADATPTSPEARAIVEDLSGWRYEALWGRNNVA